MQKIQQKAAAEAKKKEAAEKKKAAAEKVAVVMCRRVAVFCIWKLYICMRICVDVSDLYACMLCRKLKQRLPLQPRKRRPPKRSRSACCVGVWRGY